MELSENSMSRVKIFPTELHQFCNLAKPLVMALL